MKSSDPARLSIAASQDAIGHAGQEKQLLALNAVARIAALDLDLDAMLQRITDALATHFDWQLVALIVADPVAGTSTCRALTSSVPTSVHVGYSRPLGNGVVGEVAATHRAMLIDDVRLHANFIDTTPGVLSEICVPVRHKDELVAILNIESTRLAMFRHQLPLLETIADQIAGAIANARAYEKVKQQARLMEMMSEVSRDALSATNLDDFLSRVATYVHSHFPLAIVSIRLYDQERREYVRAADAGADGAREGNRWPIEDGIIGRCLRTGKTQLVLDVASDPAYIPTLKDVASELVVPIRFGDELLGVFNLESRTAAVFTPASVLAFEAFADQIAGALRLVRTHDALAAARRGLQEANEQLTGMVEKFEQMSAHDSLTGLHNRSHFDSVFPMEWRRAGRSRTPLSLLIGDIDFFKAYNDARGHRAGDQCLTQVAHTIRATVQRAGDVVVRYGGEEFAVLLPMTDLESARKIAETIRRRIGELNIQHPDPEQHLTISIGVATCIPDGDEGHASTLVEAADKALYAAKRGGRNRVVVGS